MNWYAYVGNDPVNGVDPTGLRCDRPELPGGVNLEVQRLTHAGSAEAVGASGGVNWPDRAPHDPSTLRALPVARSLRKSSAAALH